MIVAVLATGVGTTWPTEAVVIIAVVVFVPAVIVDFLVVATPRPRTMDPLASAVQRSLQGKGDGKRRARNGLKKARTSASSRRRSRLGDRPRLSRGLRYFRFRRSRRKWTSHRDSDEALWSEK